MQNNPVGGFIDYGRENVILQMFSCCSRKRSEFCKPVTKLTINFFYPGTFLSCLYLQLAFPWRFALRHYICYFLVVFFVSKSTDGCRGLPLLQMQRLEMGHINFQSRVFVSKNAVNRILKIERK